MVCPTGFGLITKLSSDVTPFYTSTHQINAMHAPTYPPYFEVVYISGYAEGTSAFTPGKALHEYQHHNGPTQVMSLSKPRVACSVQTEQQFYHHPINMMK